MLRRRLQLQERCATYERTSTTRKTKEWSTSNVKVKNNDVKIPIEIYTDSSYCRSILLEWYEKWVRNNLLENKKNISIIKKTYDIYKSFRNINIIHVRSHTNKKDEHSCGNRIADRLARDALK